MTKIETPKDVRVRAGMTAANKSTTRWLSESIYGAFSYDPAEAVKDAEILLSLCQDYLNAVEYKNKYGN